MRLALYEPDIPQNAGAILRLADCMGVDVDVIEPSGFVWSNRHLKRAGMDYMDRVQIVHHDSWKRFLSAQSNRLVLLTTKASLSHINFTFDDADILLCGSESRGVPESVHAAVDAQIRIPMSGDARSLNVAVAAAIALSEALRQTDGFPSGASQAKTTQ
jgi:tRNA (cytidine/uridine-2'-O-)-methyltransferase